VKPPGDDERPTHAPPELAEWLASFARVSRSEGAPVDMAGARAFVRRIEELDALASPELAAWLDAPAARTTSVTGKWILAELCQLTRRKDEADRWWGEVAEAADGAAKAEALLARARLARDLGRPADAAAHLRGAARTGSDFNFLTRAARFGERLAGALPAGPGRTVKIGVLVTSTTDLMVPLLKLACLRDGWRAEVQVAPFGNVRQEVLNPASTLFAGAPDFLILGLHWRDAHLPEFAEEPEREVARVVDEVVDLWRRVRERGKGTIVQHNFDLPATDSTGHLGSADPRGRTRMLREINRRLGEARTPGVIVLDFDGVAAEFGRRAWGAAGPWYQARQYPVAEALPLLVDHYVALMRASLGLTKKVLVLDLDNTLWRGVIGEDGLDGIEVGPGTPAGEAHAALQDYALELRRRGILLAVCTKNNEADARLPFQRHDGMRLKEDDFVIFVANWQPKSENLREIARRLNVGLDSFVFVDDNPVERAEVARALPEVAVVELGREPAEFVAALHRGRYFETLALSAEDRARHESYKGNLQREELQAGAASLDDFLRQLGMHVHRGAFAPAVFDRVIQLFGKTNQFNLTTRRPSAEAVRAVMADGACWTQHFRVTDRYGDNGLIGLAVARPAGADEWEIDSFLMSCRVIGRRVEDFMLATLLEAARAAGMRRVRGVYRPTAKNGLAADFYARFGMTPDPEYRGEGQAFVWDLATQAIPEFPFFTVTVIAAGAEPGGK
jgi:FkbH-like protein